MPLSLDEMIQLTELRDELHTWTFENVPLIAAEYERNYPSNIAGSDDIIAPLKVMAILSGNDELEEQLERVLARRKKKVINIDNPTEAIHEAIRSLLTQGYNTISVTQVVLELRSMFSQNYSQPTTTQLPQWLHPGRIGRLLQSLGIVDSQGIRSRVWGLNLRFYRVLPSYIEKVFDRSAHLTNISGKQPAAFCQECDSCPYKDLSCEIMAHRQARHAISNALPIGEKENI